MKSAWLGLAIALTACSAESPTRKEAARPAKSAQQIARDRVARLTPRLQATVDAIYDFASEVVECSRSINDGIGRRTDDAVATKQAYLDANASLLSETSIGVGIAADRHNEIIRTQVDGLARQKAILEALRPMTEIMGKAEQERDLARAARKSIPIEQALQDAHGWLTAERTALVNFRHLERRASGLVDPLLKKADVYAERLESDVAEFKSASAPRSANATRASGQELRTV